MRAFLREEIDIAAPADVVWRYVMDWERQGEWVPLTRAEPLGRGSGTGAQVRAWTGLGPVGFWDTMTITGWVTSADGSGSCEVLHTGRVVRGEGVFTVVARGPEGSTFVWSERLDVPAGRVGAALWKLTQPALLAGVRRSLRALAARAEAEPRPGS
jgi:hypothetical protein